MAILGQVVLPCQCSEKGGTRIKENPQKFNKLLEALTT